jgi:hypothetical protein
MLILLTILIFIYNFVSVFYALSGLEPLPTVELLYIAAFPCGVAWWLRSDTHKSDATRMYCQGLMAYTGAIVIIPYHLLKTRGVKGLLPLLVLAGSYFGSQILAAILYFVFVGSFPT